MRGHLVFRRTLPRARDLSERITIEQQVYIDGRPTREYTTRASGVPARLFRAAGDQIYAEDALRLEEILSFQIRHRQVGPTDRIRWSGRSFEIQSITPLVVGRWLEVSCRDSE